VGSRLFVVSLLTLLMFLVMDWFSRWYNSFLTKRHGSEELRVNINRVMWILLALVFWYSLIQRGLPAVFDITYFSYSLFMYALFRFFQTFYNKL
jgi:hypothetical protein